MSNDILRDIATAYSVGTYPPLNESYIFAIANHYGIDIANSKNLVGDILSVVGGDPGTSDDHLMNIVLELGGTVTINANWLEAWLLVAGGGPPATDNRITEDGDNRITEDNDNRVIQ
jgi:hypothetical protein